VSTNSTTLLPSDSSLRTVWLSAALAAFVFLTYFLTIDWLPTRGEETRWATVAREMISSGDWIVPRQQGEPFFSRPPLGSWLIAAAAIVRGELDLTAVRLPTAFAVLATSLLVMWYAARSCPPIWAFLAGLAFASCVQVLQIGRVAETDMVFALLVGGSMLGWRGTWKNGAPTQTSWLIGYLLAGLGTLAKGPQAPAYFIAAAGLCLLLERQWKSLFHWRHIVGVAAFVAVLLAWHLPVYRSVGADGVKAFWTGDVKLRWQDPSLERWATHLTTFPLELFACFLPWSIPLLLLLQKDVRREVLANPHARFALIGLAVAFPTCWFTPGAKVRYFLPLFPQMATLVGFTLAAAARLAWPSLALWLPRYGGAFAAVSLSAASLVLVGSFAGFERGLFVAPPLPLAVGFAFCCVAGWLAYRNASAQSPSRRVVVLSFASAAVFAAADLFVRMPMLVAKAVDTESLVADFRRKYDPEAPIPSIGPVHHRFAFFYRDPIPLIDESKADEVPIGSLFTLTPDGPRLFEPPFPFEALEKLPCDRNVKANGSNDYVLLARRLPSIASK
jgi:4-amino-4-deoxy-L-arabinose transferase-like glycosyltransferase